MITMETSALYNTFQNAAVQSLAKAATLSLTKIHCEVSGSGSRAYDEKVWNSKDSLQEQTEDSVVCAPVRVRAHRSECRLKCFVMKFHLRVHF